MRILRVGYARRVPQPLCAPHRLPRAQLGRYGASEAQARPKLSTTIQTGRFEGYSFCEDSWLFTRRRGTLERRAAPRWYAAAEPSPPGMLPGADSRQLSPAQTARRSRTNCMTEATSILPGHASVTRNSAPARLLVVDDEPDASEAIRFMLERVGYAVTTASTARGALEGVVNEHFDLVLTDVAMPETDGIALCRKVADLRPALPVVLVTGHSDTATLTRALRAGVRDCVTKPVDPNALLSAVARILDEKGETASSSSSKLESQQEARDFGLAALIGESEGIRRVRSLILDLADSCASVIVTGETGTGKEIVARALHATSRRSAGPFLALNCAAVPAGLLESELFGHGSGAFTDAKLAKSGLLVEANGGTLLLDEIGELPLSMQPKLLRALQEHTVRPIGEHREVPFDCRLIAAANQDLEREVKAKRFREDLFYRLDVIRITVPPLRTRGDDILLLALHFLKRFAGSRGVASYSDAAAAKLLGYAWPGNVRELENCIARAVALSRSARLTVADLPEKVQRPELARDAPPTASAEPEPIESLFDAERRHVLRTIELVGGDKTRAAAVLKIDRRTLYRRLERY